MNNQTIVVMGGGTAGWISALYFLNKSKKLNLNLNVKLISSDDIKSIGVGEGTISSFKNFIKNVCNIDEFEFLRETKSSIKYGIKFKNWNFDNDFYYNVVSFGNIYEMSEENTSLNIDMIQYAINNDFNIPCNTLQKKLFGEIYDLLENNKLFFNMFPSHSYNIDANLIIPFFKKKCLEFQKFEYIEGTISDVSYSQNGFIEKISTFDNNTILGDFFINCLGFKSEKILNKDYFNIKSWNDYILNDSALAIQVKNSENEVIDLYATSTAQEYGWSWKVPQYEKTGYGYVYSSDFINDTDKLFNNILKTYNIDEKKVFKEKVVKAKPYYNTKQIHKNCLSLGLSSGFVEPLESTSIHMTLISLEIFFELIENKIELNDKYKNIFNEKIEKNWNNIFKFVIFHYFTKNPINNYWKFYKNIHDKKIFDFHEKYNKQVGDLTFNYYSYSIVSIGKKMKDHYYNFFYERFLKDNIDGFLSLNKNINMEKLITHNNFLKMVNNFNQDKKYFNYH